MNDPMSFKIKGFHDFSRHAVGNRIYSASIVDPK